MVRVADGCEEFGEGTRLGKMKLKDQGRMLAVILSRWNAQLGEGAGPRRPRGQLESIP